MEQRLNRRRRQKAADNVDLVAPETSSELSNVSRRKTGVVTAKEAPKIPVVKQPKISVRVLELHRDLMPHLIKAKAESPSSPFKFLKERVIPYLLPKFIKGTQVVQIRLPLLAYKISVTTATAYTTVKNIDASILASIADVAGLFDEYRAIRGLLEYHAAFPNVTSSCFGGAAVDYSVSAAFGTFDAMNSHDCKQIGMFNNLFSYDLGKVRFRWPLLLEPLPDQDWIPTTNTGVVFAYWKPYIISTTINSTEDTGYLLGWVDIQCRGLAA